METLLTRAIAEVSSAPRLLRLKPAVQGYAWGGYDFIPGLLGEPNDARSPRAEMWIGAHPVAPARVVMADGEVSLADMMARAAEALVGPDLVRRFGPTLPYLLKVLDVRSMLSIQTHPDAVQAREGYAREEAQRIGRSAPNRSYRDASHKPEASVALTEFWMLFGFRPLDAIVATFRDVPELQALFGAVGFPRPDAGDMREAGDSEWLRSAYARVMRLPQRTVDETLAPLVARLQRDEAEGRLDPSEPAFWAARAAGEFRPAEGATDRGLVSIYLLNLVKLEPGDGIYIPAGVLHAYLSGVAVEIMAASDNVLRGGLTSKHVDLEELLRVVRFDPTRVEKIGERRESTGELVYDAPAVEFRLGRVELEPGASFAPGVVRGADALLVLEGEALASAASTSLELWRGSAVLATCGLDYTVHARTRTVFVRASVPPLPSP